MGRTISTLHDMIGSQIKGMKVIREGLTAEEKKMCDETMNIFHINERAISLACIPDTLDCMILVILFGQYKMIRHLEGNPIEWHDDSLENHRQ